MFENQQDAKSAVLASAAILHEIMMMYDKFGLSIAAAHLASALDAACAESGVDRSTLSAQFFSTAKNHGKSDVNSGKITKSG